MINNTMPNAYIKGKAFFATIIGGVSDNVPATNKSNPNGGVAKPIDKQHTIITPKCTGCTPKALTAGSKIGDKMTIAGPVSITIPSKRNITTMPVNTVKLVVKLFKINPSINAGAFANARTLPKATANASTKQRGAYVLTAFARNGIISLTVNDLYITNETNSE